MEVSTRCNLFIMNFGKDLPNDAVVADDVLALQAVAASSRRPYERPIPVANADQRD
jgi:hypothetical protein